MITREDFKLHVPKFTVEYYCGTILLTKFPAFKCPPYVHFTDLKWVNVAGRWTAKRHGTVTYK